MPDIGASDRPVVIVDPAPRKTNEIFTAADRKRLHEMASVAWGHDEPISRAEFDAVRDEAVAVITTRWRHGAVDQLPRLRAILEVGGRLPSPKDLDYATCFARNIHVLTCAPAFGPMVAELALGMAIAAVRNLVPAHNDFAAGREIYLRSGNTDTFTLYDKPVGLIGYGGLARSLRPLLAPFRTPLYVHDPWLPDSYLQRQGVQSMALETLLQTSRVIFVLAIPSRENRALLDRAHLDLIQPDSVLILISRAHLVDFDALTELLLAGRFRAAIDVFPTEPLPVDHPIRRAPGVILSAHRAGSVHDELRQIGRMAVDDLAAILAGLPPTAMQAAQPELITRLE